MKITKKLNDGKIKLTKNNINDGYIREIISNQYKPHINHTLWIYF